MEENKITEFDVDASLRRLEEINRRLSDKNIELKVSLDLYREGVELAAKCQEHLKGIETELQIIMGAEA